MANILKHIFVSGKADGADATLLQPGDWNEGMVASSGNNGSVLVRDTSDATYGMGWVQSVASGQLLASAGAGSLPAWSTTLVVSGAGPHAIGGATDSTIQLSLRGSFAERIGLEIYSSLSPPAGASVAALYLAPTFVEAASGVHALLASHRIDVATVTASVATVTDTASLYIAGAMSATVTGANYALWVKGLTRIDGNLNFNAPTSANAMLKADGIDLDVKLGDDSNYTRLRAGVLEAEDWIAGPGTIATTGAIRLANNTTLVWRDAANASNLLGLQINASNQLELYPSGNDIKWGRALVALGGGAAPTLGTIGGSGPTAAAQNAWMRVIDSAGAAFWVPAWK